MNIKIITVSVLDSVEGEQALNQFLNSQRIVSVEKQFVQFEQAAFWSFVISYQGNSTSHSEKRRTSIDYKEVLNDEDFNRFAQIRELRNNLAKKIGKPAYAIFTNEQIAKMVTGRVESKSALAAIEGVGESRLENYADQFLPLLQKLHSETSP